MSEQPTSEQPIKEQTVLPLRKNRDFLLLWTGAGFASLGVQLTAVIYPLLVVWQTGSASAAGFVVSAVVLPHLVVQLPAGALVDRFDRRRMMILSDVGSILVAGAVLLSVLNGLIWVPGLMLAGFAHSSFGIFYELAERTAVRHLVHESQVPVALSRNEARRRAVGMLGDPLGSLLFSFLRWIPFLLTVLAHLVSLLELLLIRKSFQTERSAAAREPFGAEIAEGMRWLWRQAFLRTAMLLIAGTNLVFAGIILTLILIIHDSGGSPAAVGVILAIGGLGGVLGAVTASWWRRRLSMRAVLPAGLFVWTLSIAPLAFVDEPVGLGVVLALCGYVGGAINVLGYVYTVEVTPDELLGRTMSVMMLLGSGANFLGALGIGFSLEAWGVTGTAIAMAGVMGVMGVIALVHPAVRNVGIAERDSG